MISGETLAGYLWYRRVDGNINLYNPRDPDTVFVLGLEDLEEMATGAKEEPYQGPPRKDDATG